jgi:pyruvate,water dikinase
MQPRLHKLLLKLGLRPAGRREPAGDGLTVWRFQSLFNNFRRILDQNNTALQQMEAMERALGGDYIFDHAFLESSVRQLCTVTHHVAYNLNALTRNRHVALYDRFQEIAAMLHQILAGAPVAAATKYCIPMADIGWELESEVGLTAVCLAELRRQARIPVMEGYVVTAPACRSLLEHGMPQAADGSEPHGAAAVLRQMIKATEELVSATGAGHLSVALAALDPVPGAWLPGSRPVTPPEVPDALLALLRQAADREKGVGWAALVQEGLAAPLCGEINTRAFAERRLDLLRIIARRPDAPGQVDRYLLRRAQPFDLLLSELAPRPMDRPLPDGAKPIQRGPGRLRRGSALLDSSAAKALAEAAVIVERLFGTPCVVHWGAASQGRLAVRGITPREVPVLAGSRSDPSDRLADRLARCRVDRKSVV